MKKIIAITGGIGSGKSVISQILRAFSYPVYDTDKEAKRLTVISSAIQEEIKKSFPFAVVNNQIDNKILAQRVFADPILLHNLNSIIHPAVKIDLEAWVTAQKSNFVFCESAILFESGFNAFVDIVWVVTAPLELRIQRIMARDGATRAAVQQRIASQWSQDELIKRGDVEIVNDETTPLLSQIQQQIAQLNFI